MNTDMKTESENRKRNRKWESGKVGKWALAHFPALRTFSPAHLLTCGFIAAALLFCAPARAQVGLPVRVYQLGETVSAPVVTNITTTVVTLFSTNKAQLDGKVLNRFVQNHGTVPVLYAINFTNVSATAYHGVIAPGVALRDGLGSVVDFSAIRFPVSFRTESGSAEITIVEIKQ
jgi:hypothetical protein